MLALVGLVGNLGGGAVVVHRLGRRHIGVRPFKTKGNGGQIGWSLEFLGDEQADTNLDLESTQKKAKVPLSKKKKAIRKQKFASGG